MKLLAIVAVFAAAGAAQTPDVAAIMERVGENQERASDLRQEFTFHQKQILRMNRGSGKIAREEKREYTITPQRHRTNKDLVHFEGRYEHNGKHIPYDRPGYTYKEIDIDGELIDD